MNWLQDALSLVMRKNKKEIYYQLKNASKNVNLDSISDIRNQL